MEALASIQDQQRKHRPTAELRRTIEDLWSCAAAQPEYLAARRGPSPLRLFPADFAGRTLEPTENGFPDYPATNLRHAKVAERPNRSCRVRGKLGRAHSGPPRTSLQAEQNARQDGPRHLWSDAANSAEQSPPVAIRFAAKSGPPLQIAPLLRRTSKARKARSRKHSAKMVLAEILAPDLSASAGPDRTCCPQAKQPPHRFSAPASAAQQANRPAI